MVIVNCDGQPLSWIRQL